MATVIPSTPYTARSLQALSHLLSLLPSWRCTTPRDLLAVLAPPPPGARAGHIGCIRTHMKGRVCSGASNPLCPAHRDFVVTTTPPVLAQQPGAQFCIVVSSKRIRDPVDEVPQVHYRKYISSENSDQEMNPHSRTTPWMPPHMEALGAMHVGIRRPWMAHQELEPGA
jgi:hypothetical protein